MHSLTSNTYFFQTADTVTTMTLKDARNGNEFLISSSKEFSMLLNVIGWFFHLKEEKENNVKLVRLPTKKHIGNSSGNSVAFCSNTEQKSCEQNINNLFRQLCPEQINRNCGSLLKTWVSIKKNMTLTLQLEILCSIWKKFPTKWAPQNFRLLGLPWNCNFFQI